MIPLIFLGVGQISALIENGRENGNADMQAGDGRLTVTEVHIQLHIVPTWTGILDQEVSTKESDSLLKMEETLHKHVVDQDEPVQAISPAIPRARVAPNSGRREVDFWERTDSQFQEHTHNHVLQCRK